MSKKVNLKIPEELLGIPQTNYLYHILDENQNRDIETQKTTDFLNFLINKYPEDFPENTVIYFINYGDTEQVYVINNIKKNIKQTLLIGQPLVKYGEIKLEYENLQKLFSKYGNLIIKPIKYFTNNIKEGFLTPYLYQARCIACDDNLGYGVYKPDPYYDFFPYNEKDQYIICKCIIAYLIFLYNDGKGLGGTKIGGGDFIIEKEYDNEEHNVENALKRMHLTAARFFIDVSLEKYIELIKNEFVKRTYYKNLKDRNKDILINWKSRCGMPVDAVEDGVKLGLELRKKNNV